MSARAESFSSDAYPSVLRARAWSEVLARLYLKACADCPAARLVGFATVRDSPAGARFGHLKGGAQTLVSLGAESRHGAIIVFVCHHGVGRVTTGDRDEAIAVGDGFVMDAHSDWRIDFDADFAATVAVLGESGFARRVLNTRRSNFNCISRSSTLGAVAADLLRSAGERLDALEPGDLGQVESALTGMMLPALAHETEDVAESASTSVQLAHLRRVCQLIDSHLTEADLDLARIAHEARLSPRYVQRLFSGAGTTFGAHVRKRRLYRCRNDLRDPALSHFAIGELCFRWGFGDAANFTRAFVREFGYTPSACRVAAQEPKPVRLRGRPDSAGVPSLSAHPGATTLRREIDAQYRDEDGASHHYLHATSETVHWGYFNRFLEPVARVRSGDRITIEALTQHATDDVERMVHDDPGAESVFRWDAGGKAVERRGAGPLDASIFGRGAGEGFGVHVCTGPVYVEEAEPGDVLEVRIVDIRQRPSRNPEYAGRSFGSNAATWWGYHYHDLLTEPRPREVVTIYELHATGYDNFARAVYSFRWTPQTDPSGVRHDTIDYPGVPVDHSTIHECHGVLDGVRIPLRPHFGVLAVAPRQEVDVDSIPPGCFGGNLDNWRAAPGASLFLPVGVPGALFSVGDPHASQGDSELCGTAIECSLTGDFDLIVHKACALEGHYLAELDHPFLETPDEWVIQGLSHPNHLVELGPAAQTEVYKRASLDLAMRDAFRKTRRFLMTAHGLSEDEAISLLSVGVDFGVTQVVNGNLGVHAIVRKSMLREREG